MVSTRRRNYSNTSNNNHDLNHLKSRKNDDFCSINNNLINENIKKERKNSKTQCTACGYELFDWDFYLNFIKIIHL